MKQPLVSVITPLYNRVGLVGETIQSVVAQTYPHWEMVVVDDGSTDGSYEYVQEIAQQEPRITLLRRDRTPKGGSTCRNIGLKQAQGEYIIFLDSDDLLAPHCLEQRTQLLQQFPKYDFLVFPTQAFWYQPKPEDQLFDRIFYQDYLTSFILQSHWLTPCPIWKKGSLKTLGGFDEQLTCMQDGDLNHRALIRGCTFRVFKGAEYLDNYFRREDTYSKISSTRSLENYDSKVYAYQKLFALLQQHNLSSPVRRTIIAGHLLSLSVRYRLMGQVGAAYQLWRTTRQQRIASSYEYWIGMSFIWIRSKRPIRRSEQRSRWVRNCYQRLSPRFLFWP